MKSSAGGFGARVLAICLVVCSLFVISPAVATLAPTTSPTTSTPSTSPTTSPVVTTSGPTTSPVVTTNGPTASPAAAVTNGPTTSPVVTTNGPTASPAIVTNGPTASPGAAVTEGPTSSPVGGGASSVPTSSPVAVSSLSPTSSPSTLAGAKCRPEFSIPKKRCDRIIRGCKSQGINMKWTGKGCKDEDGNRLGDGGCQCHGYCGFQCKQACNRNHGMCYWVQGDGCYSKITHTKGVPMPTC